VLVIEDNADAAEVLRMMLELEGHDVRVASDGGEGVTAALADPPDVVLCDIGLPGMDGFAVARTLAADARLSRARLYALSGYATPEDARRAREAGFLALLAKPASPEQLAAAVAGTGRFAPEGAPG
jgi:two-component system CheB/CheR fusion protein